MRKLIKIHNPVDIAHAQRLSVEYKPPLSPGKINLLAVGRLHQQKGFDLLLQAMALTANEKLHLHILGQGEEETALRHLAERLRLSKRVTFHGFQKNPYAFMAMADAFVMASRYEGFPNALIEAMSLGCPAIAFECQGGINEIIQDGVNGYRVEFSNINKLALLLDKGDFLGLNKQRIAQIISDRYRLDMIITQYERYLTAA